VGELRPGAFLRLFAEVQAAQELKTRRVMAQLGTLAERQAKINASVGAHRRGTPTPARPGTGPAVISGTLRRSLTHGQPARTATGWQVKVGTGVGFTPSYGRTPANRYGYYLETGLRNGSTYPFLLPAAQFVMRIAAPQLYRAAFSAGWPRH
jgi:hypothetical protein